MDTPLGERALPGAVVPQIAAEFVDAGGCHQTTNFGAVPSLPSLDDLAAVSTIASCLPRWDRVARSGMATIAQGLAEHVGDSVCNRLAIVVH